MSKVFSTLGTFTWGDPHPHDACIPCQAHREATHRELTEWLLTHHSESKQVLAERMLKEFKVEKR